jgi:D-xylose transport system substrate-binding protein
VRSASSRTAGLRDSQFVIQNALGSDAVQFADAQADIAEGARVLILDPIGPGVGARIESYAKRHGATVIDYDRLTVGDSRRYFVGFDDVAIGKAIGLGLVATLVRLWPGAAADLRDHARARDHGASRGR